LFSPSEEKYLLDIEKLIKAPVTRGTLQIPGELIARASERSQRPERPERGSRPEGRSGVDRQGDRGSERGARPSRYSAPVKPIDQFFLKPYEPSAAAVAAAAQAPASATKKPALLGKRAVGLLLGGAVKKL
jgi:hypothetical protein